MKATRVLVVGVASILRDTEGFTVVGEAGDGREAVARAQALAPDVVPWTSTCP